MCASILIINLFAKISQIALAIDFLFVSRVVYLFPNKSTYTGTRKMVNYTCAERSQEKF